MVNREGGLVKYDLNERVVDYRLNTLTLYAYCVGVGLGVGVSHQHRI